MTRVALYARYSTDQQDATSIERQVSNCEALAEREGFHVAFTFQDEAGKGQDNDRPGYRELLKCLERGDVQGVICDALDRLSRSEAELHRLADVLEFGDQFIVTAEGDDSRSGESFRWLLAVKATAAAQERRKIAYRTYGSLRERHKAGRSAGGKIYGYTSEPTPDGYRRRVIDPEQASIVREIFERYVDGESPKAIARDLNARGVPSPGSYWSLKARRSDHWTHTTLTGSESKASGILRNPIYTGRATWNKRKGKYRPGTKQRIQLKRPEDQWSTVEIPELRIVTDEQFKAAQERLRLAKLRVAPKGPRRPRGRPARYLLSGILKCGSCGSNYIIANGRSFTCSAKTNGGHCDHKRYIVRERVEREVLSGIKDDLLSPDLLREAGKRIQAKLRERNRNAKQSAGEVRGLRLRLKELDGEIARVVDAITQAGMSDALKRKLATLEREQANAKKRLAEHVTRSAKLPDILPQLGEKWRAFVADLQHAQGDIEPARKALKELLGPVIVTEENGKVFATMRLGPEYVNALFHGAEERT
ncbi:MAG TPA: recombinase family protein [Gammaproteobacteria bacterium]